MLLYSKWNWFWPDNITLLLSRPWNWFWPAYITLLLFDTQGKNSCMCSTISGEKPALVRRVFSFLVKRLWVMKVNEPVLVLYENAGDSNGAFVFFR